ncbi:excinuclease UvrABC ATPase subunit [Salinicoccus halitifaciens]|uniref:UvrABC system protein A n=1 Tax=Salinicoccus halitifaciens TaxID=1073415 RepID=A0ABV2EDZ7_9STAP
MFSYNSEGACPECSGKGIIKTELAFMADMSQVCEVCGGTRYRPEVLEAKVEGYSIADILALTVEEAINLFQENQTVRERLLHLEQTGLQYMTLGQSLDTLSGGEMQRLKLSSHLDSEASGMIYIFDEPTTGLHERDIPTLLNCFEKLIEAGNTVLIVEHNLTMMTHADWLIDIGPGAGKAGGRVLYTGRPRGLLEVEESVTAKHLKRYVNGL